MRFWKLRIAWSVVWGVVTMLLIGLWTPSYSHQIHFLGWTSSARSVSVLSYNGWMQFDTNWHDTSDWVVKAQLPNWEATIRHIEPDPLFGITPNLAPHPRWSSYHSSERLSSYSQVTVPGWFPVLVAISLTGLPWITLSRRFSLRTLLIATAVVAVVLGLIIWVVR
jgi:hypothetical protein